MRFGLDLAAAFAPGKGHVHRAALRHLVDQVRLDFSVAFPSIKVKTKL